MIIQTRLFDGSWNAYDDTLQYTLFTTSSGFTVQSMTLRILPNTHNVLILAGVEEIMLTPAILAIDLTNRNMFKASRILDQTTIDQYTGLSFTWIHNYVDDNELNVDFLLQEKSDSGNV
jgi:hypothetical protein